MRYEDIIGILVGVSWHILERETSINKAGGVEKDIITQILYTRRKAKEWASRRQKQVFGTQKHDLLIGEALLLVHKLLTQFWNILNTKNNIIFILELHEKI